MLFCAAGLIALAANFTIESLAQISRILIIPGAVVAMMALSIGAVLPELFNSLAVIAKKKQEVIMGNVFAAVTINLLLVCGISALFMPLPIDSAILTVGMPFLAVSAGLLVISSFSRKINFGEGLVYLFLYFLFFVKLFNLF
jgi:cation:H+ antiporter